MAHFNTAAPEFKFIFPGHDNFTIALTAN